MMVWTIYREGDGPMRAFRNLGEDLKTTNPKYANSLLTEMASSVVRNEIANTTIDDLITNREMLR
jgi:regulator of protease activity HflC (stomatin/prohibitin superfamily)